MGTGIHSAKNEWYWQGEICIMEKFSKQQLDIMRKAYGTLKTMNPSSPTYKKFIKFLGKLPKDQLKQLANAKIKFVSILAKNRLRRESVNEAVSPRGWNMSKKFIAVLAREVKNLQKYHRQQNDEDFLEVANYMELQLKYMKKNLNESVNEAKFDSTGIDWSDDMMWKWVSKALKTAGIKELKYTPMKSGWLGSKFVWGGFYKVQANKRTDVLPITVDKKGKLWLNVSPKKYIIGKIGQLPQVIYNLKDFKKSDLDVYESVNEANQTAMYTQTFDKLLKKQTKGKQPTLKDLDRVYDLMRKRYKELDSRKYESVNEAYGDLNDDGFKKVEKYNKIAIKLVKKLENAVRHSEGKDAVKWIKGLYDATGIMYDTIGHRMYYESVGDKND